MNTIPPRTRAITCALLCGATIAATACGDAEQDPWHLGPLDGDAGAQDTAPGPDSPAPAPAPLAVTVCNSTPVIGDDITRTVRAVATLEGRGVLTLPGSVRAVQLDADGCPGAPLSSFGVGGTLAIDASHAVPLPGGRTLVAGPTHTVLLDSTATQVGRCEHNSEDVLARVLDAQADGLVAAAFVRSPIALLQTDLSAPSSCGVTWLALSPAPFALVAVGRARVSGFVTVEQVNAASPLVVARYGDDGQRVAASRASGPEDPAWLCSASAVADTPSGIAVADAACNRVVVYDATTMAPVGAATLTGSPRGMALTQSGKHVVVPVATAIADGAVATFVRVALP